MRPRPAAALPGRPAPVLVAVVLAVLAALVLTVTAPAALAVARDRSGPGAAGPGPGPWVVASFPAEPTVSVPRVVGLRLREAVDRLEDAGLVLGTRRAPGDRVVGQTPAAGTRVVAGSRLLLDLTPRLLTVVEADEVRVPRVVGLRLREAVDRMEDAGLVLGTRRAAGDRVLEQAPATGTWVPAGSRVLLRLTGPAALDGTGVRAGCGATG